MTGLQTELAASVANRENQEFLFRNQWNVPLAVKETSLPLLLSVHSRQPH